MKLKLTLCFLLICTAALFQNNVSAQQTVKKNFDSETFKNKAVEEVNSEIQGQVEDWLSKGEAAAMDAVYWKDILSQYEPWGVDPEASATDYYNKAVEVYTKIKEDPQYDPKAELSGTVKDMVKARVENEIGKRFEGIIDKESQEILDGLADIYDDAKGKTTNILKGLEKIGDWDEEADDFQSKVEAEVRSWGIKGPLADYIGDLDQMYTSVNDNYGTRISAAGDLISMMNQDDPTAKIEGLFEFGATYGGEIPILGDIVSSLFEVGKELLAAAKRAGGILEQNYGQGCMNTAGEYNSLTSKKKKFRDKFPNVTSACPMSYSISSGPYYNIYIENKNLFFYYDKEWHGAPGTTNNRGADDVRAIVQWLRKIENENYYDLATIYSIYNKEPGFTVYRDRINVKAKAIQNRVQKNVQNISFCDETGLESYLFETIDLNWVRKLIGEGQLDLSRAKLFDDGLIEQIEDKLLENRYFRSGSRNNLDHLDRISANLIKNVPVFFTGKVVSLKTGKALEGAKVSPPFPSLLMFTEGSCHKLTTDANGKYAFYMSMDPNSGSRVSIMANYQGVSNAPEFEIDLTQKTYFEFNLEIDIGEETQKTEKEKCEAKGGYVWDSENSVCLLDLSCTEIENTIKILNASKTAYLCDCVSPNKWNDDKTACLTPSQFEEETSEPDSTETTCDEPFMAWKAETNTCECIDGYTKNDEGNCVEKGDLEEDGLAKLEVTPSAINLGIADEVTFQLIYTDSLGASTDVSAQLSPQPFFPGKEGVHRKEFSYKGLTAVAVVTVSGCADPNAEEIDGDCKCKDGFTPDKLGNCQLKESVFSVIKIEPSVQTIGVGGNPNISVFGVNALGQTLDITSKVNISGLSGVGDVSGSFTVSADFQGLTDEATIQVNECGDPNAELDFSTGDCKCKEGYFPDDEKGCVSEEELKEELEEEAKEECENLSALASEYSAVVGQIGSFRSDFQSFSDRFMKEVNDRAADLCQNQMAAFSYAQALTAYENLVGSIDQGKELYFELSFLRQCPKYEEETGQYNLGAYDLGSLLDQVASQQGMLSEMGSRIKENGCNEEDLEDVGRTIVDEDKDPELISMGGTGNELSGDGKDNDGEGQQDEIPVSAEPGFNVTIVIYDSGTAKDDVFALNISGVGDLGTTPEGGLRTYPLQLPSGFYDASITVLEDGGNVGTYTINIFVNGISVFSTSGSPEAGFTDSYSFTVE